MDLAYADELPYRSNGGKCLLDRRHLVDGNVHGVDTKRTGTKSYTKGLRSFLNPYHKKGPNRIKFDWQVYSVCWRL